MTVLVKSGRRTKFIQDNSLRLRQDSEHVFYSNQASHAIGTNIYQFDFPEEWRTSNNEFKFGIRSIYVQKYPRTVSFEMKIDSVLTSWEFLFRNRYTSTNFIEYLNKRLKEVSEIGSRWEYVPKEDAIILTSSENFEITAQSFDNIGFIRANNHSAYINMWDRDELLIRTNFTNHLGITGNVYSPPKMYYFNPPLSKSFQIELYDAYTLNPVELPEDNKDYIVIEAILKF
jgi:hypothetical protein